MLSHSLFRIFLHFIVDGGIDSQAVFVEVVGRAVRLRVFVEPAIERVIRPLERVHHIVLILGVRGTFRLLCVHRAAEHVPEIWSQAGIVVLYLIVQCNWNLLDGIPFRLRDESGLGHL